MSVEKVSEVVIHTNDVDFEQIQLKIDPAEEAKLVRKIDLHLLLPLWLIFVLCLLDRINLGNVAVLGITQDLHLEGNDLNVALQVFFVPYILVDIPSNILLKKFKPSTWISSLTFLWGKSSI